MNDDENQEGQSQEAQGKKGNSGGSSNPVKKIKNGADNVQKSAGNFSKATGKMAEKAGQFAGKNAGKASGQMAARTAKYMASLSKSAGKVAANAGKIAASAGKVAATLGPIMLWVAIAIVLLFIIVGLLTYILNGPGIFWGKIQDICKKISEVYFIEETRCKNGLQYVIKKDSVEEIAETLDQLGYDLYGYGFITKPIEMVFDTEIDEDEYSEEEINQTKDETIAKINSEFVENETDNSTNETEGFQSGTASKYILKEKYIEAKDEDDENSGYLNVLASFADMKYIFQYLVTDNYCKTIANTNGSGSGRINKVAAVTIGTTIAIVAGVVGGFLAGVFTAGIGWIIAGVVGVAALGVGGGFSGYTVAEKNNITINLLYGKGFIKLYDEKREQISMNDAGKADDGTRYGISDDGKLIIEPKGSNVKFEYDLDKIGDQYGMPVEFLMSTHIATAAPDLAYKLATEFSTTDESTNVNIKMAKDEDAILNSRIVTSNGKKIEYSNLVGASNTEWWDFANNFSSKQAYDFMKKYGVVSIEGTGTDYDCLGIPNSVNEHSWSDFWNLTLQNSSYISYSGEPNNEDFFSWENVNTDRLLHQIKERKDTIGEDGVDSIYNQLRCQEIKYGEENGDPYKSYRGNVIASIPSLDGKTIEYFSVDFEMKYNVSTDQYATPSHYSGTIKLKTQAASCVAEGHVCSDEENKTDRVCENCEKYIQLLLDVAGDINNQNLNMCVPYIASVTNHWYRNVYFEESEIELANDNVIKVDEEYEKKTGERWTLYEMYKDKNDNEQYALFLYVDQNNDGNINGDEVKDFYKYNGKYPMLISAGYEYNARYYKKSKDGVSYIRANIEEDDDDKASEENRKENKEVEYFVLCYWVEGKEKYTLGDKAEINVEKFRVGKKAILEDVDKIWKGNSSAYEEDEFDTCWQRIVPNEEENNPNTRLRALESVGGHAEYDLKYHGKKQVEDGVRGETNPRIKEIFLDEYYLYDGSIERAAVIAKAKKENKTSLTDEDNKTIEIPSDDPDDWTDEDKKYSVYIDSNSGVIYEKDSDVGYDTEDGQTPITLKALYDDTDGDYYNAEHPQTQIVYCENDEYYADPNKTEKASITKITAGKSDITGPVNIVRNSLSAFSILKNMGTVAAEYIYHDFKELITELDYFDKEDLVEVTNKVMMFPVKAMNNYNWPLSYEKDEANYGTMILSNEDLLALRDKREEEDIISSYKGEDDFVSPATGEVIKYGIVTRKNLQVQKEIDDLKAKINELKIKNPTGNAGTINEYNQKIKAYEENNLNQDVGFIKIKLANNDLNKISDEDKIGYKYFFEEYSIDVGIAGNVLYIEGFDVSDILKDAESAKNKANYSGENKKKLLQYINGEGKDKCSYKTSYQIPNLLNDDLEKELDEQEKAKRDAVYGFEQNGSGKIFIKEGAIIGKTFKDEGCIEKNIEVTITKKDGTEEKKNETHKVGNYIRLIFRDLHDEVIENVEDYIENDSAYDLHRLTSMLDHELCPGSEEEPSFLLGKAKVRNESGEWVLAEQEDFDTMAKVCVFVAINRAENESKTIAEVLRSGAYGEAGMEDANATSIACQDCAKIVKWCLEHECTDVVTSEGVKMTKNCTTESGYPHFCNSAWVSGELEPFWYIDTMYIDSTDPEKHGYGADGKLTCGNSGEKNVWDTFFCRVIADNEKYGAQEVEEYPPELFEICNHPKTEKNE